MEKHTPNHWRSGKLLAPGFAGLLNGTVVSGQDRCLCAPFRQEFRRTASLS
jgi:hypothetical protein